MSTSQGNEMRALLVKILPRPALFFDVEVCEHCNLNCKGCGSLAPIAKKEFLDLEQYERDMKHLSALSSGEVHHINLLGGEPLLHPEIHRILNITRDSFPIGEIRIVTNGILLKTMKEVFWEVCKEKRISVTPTKYPVNIDYKALEDIAKKHSVNYYYFGSDHSSGAWAHIAIDLSGGNSELDSWLQCGNANNCAVYSDGKIFQCPRTAKIRHFNEYFNVHLPLSPKDYLEVQAVHSLDEIMNFYTHATPFCRFCNPATTRPDTWGISNLEMQEWL